MRNYIYTLYSILLLLATGCKQNIEEVEASNNNQAKAEETCMPDMFRYDGYNTIIYHTVQIVPDDEHDLYYWIGRNINPLGGTYNMNTYFSWRFGEGCGIMHYFIEAELKDFHGHSIKKVSEIYESTISQTKVNTLYKVKDKYLNRIGIQYDNQPTTYLIHVVDGPYMAASTIKENILNTPIY